jgi:hypothetical protein
MIAFALRFPLSDIGVWAEQYRAAMKLEERVLISEVVPKARGRGRLTKAEFLAICYWKSPRSQARCRRNDEDFVRSVTATALSTDNERLRIEVLRLLDGVEWPTASAILHLVHPDRYPLLDVRALWSVCADACDRYDFTLWQAYTAFCREIADASGESMRDLDRALYQFSVAQSSAGTASASRTE